MPDDAFRAFFKSATGVKEGPYPYQEKLARQPIQSRLTNIPTGCGKTVAAVLGWLWQRKQNPKATPRRLVPCLLTRVLVGQTRHKACELVRNLECTIWPTMDVHVHALMGGEVEEDCSFCQACA